MVKQVMPSARRLDLGEAVVTASRVLSGEKRPGEVLLLSDVQATALGPATVAVPLTVGRPRGEPPRNAGIASLDVGPQPWSVDGGRVAVTLAGDSGVQSAITVRLGDRPPREALATVGDAVTLAVPPAAPAGACLRPTSPATN
jgi:hypothetical protein